MTILANIAFLRKAGGAPWEEATSAAAMTDAARSLDQVPLMGTKLRRQGERLEAMEDTLATLVRQLAEETARREAKAAKSIFPWRRRRSRGRAAACAIGAIRRPRGSAGGPPRGG